MIKLFTHTDLDGIGCAVLMKIAFPDINVEIEYCNYDEINQKVKEFMDNDSGYDCFITDISINDELAEMINKSYRKDTYLLLDHHPTALQLNKYEWCNVQIENEDGVKTSGTELLYKWLTESPTYFLHKNEVLDRFVKLVRDYDTWRWSTLGEDGLICKQVNDLLYLYGREKFIEWCVTDIKYNTFPFLHHSDKLVLDIKQKEIDDYIEKKNSQMITSPMCGKICGFVFAEQYFSELGNKLCQMHPEIDFVSMIDIANGTVSYRTVKDDIDLGKDVAKMFGGGGHPKAAGSQFSKDVQCKIIEEIFGK